jgi:glycine/D-amino acid oxidase-like deaminating enzyme
MLSFWEKEIWFKDLDLVVIGGGLVGLSSAIFFKLQNPDAKVLICERAAIPSGASTKNAGFACFGSPSELIDDFNHQTEKQVVNLVKKRYQGLQKLRELLGDAAIGYENTGGFELFSNKQKQLFDDCEKALPRLNALLTPIFGSAPYLMAHDLPEKFGFKGFNRCIALPFEGMIDTGLMMRNLIQKAQNLGVLILNGIEIQTFEDLGLRVSFDTTLGRFNTKKLLVCTNGFAKKILPQLEVEPARAQVLITNELEQLLFKGVFHFNQGYYYFRNVGNRVLFGGGRNMDRDNERTLQMETSATIQNHLKKLLKTNLLPQQKFEIEDSWAGIMGMGAQNEKLAIVKMLSPRVGCAVRLGGMGIALGAGIAEEAVQMLSEKKN